jgi:hypothetical protein
VERRIGDLSPMTRFREFLHALTLALNEFFGFGNVAFSLFQVL